MDEGGLPDARRDEPAANAPLLVAAGYLNLDLVARVPRLPGADERVTATAIRRGLGGMAANAAVAAAALGAPYPVRVDLVSAVGADPDGEWLLAELGWRGVGTGWVTRGAAGRTCRCLILVEADGRRAIVSEPIAFPEALLRRRLDQAGSVATPRLLYLDGYRVPASLATAERARTGGWEVALDLDGLPEAWRTPEGFGRLLGAADVLFLNRGVARATWPGVGWDEVGRGQLSTLEDKFAMILARYPGADGSPTVLLTLAEDGVLVAGGDGACRRVPSVAATPADTTGAGDVFAGAFLAGWLHRAPPVEAARFATAAAALAISQEATERTPPTGKAIAALLGRS